MPKPAAFDWRRVRWDDADAPQRNDCSYCSAAIDDDAVPLRMWNARGDSCVFCEACAGPVLVAFLPERPPS